ncbi:hypothetical protein LguiA_028991 [Lonicera macranthoides]
MQPMSIITNVDRPQQLETLPLWPPPPWVGISICVFAISCVVLYIIVLAILSPKNCKFDITKAGFESVKLFESNKIKLDFWVEGILWNPKRWTAQVHGIRMEVMSQNSWLRQLIISPLGTNFHIRKTEVIDVNAYMALQNITMPAEYLEVPMHQQPASERPNISQC